MYLVSWIVGLAVFVGIVLGLFVLITRSTRWAFGPRRRLGTDLAMEVLRGRLTRGEITDAEFAEAARILGATSDRAPAPGAPGASVRQPWPFGFRIVLFVLGCLAVLSLMIAALFVGAPRG